MTEHMKQEAAALLDTMKRAEKIHPAGSHEQAEFLRYALAVAWPRLRAVLEAAAA